MLQRKLLEQQHDDNDTRPDMWPTSDEGRWDSSAAIAGIVSGQVTGAICALSGICLAVETWGDIRAAGDAANSITRILFSASIGIITFGVGAAMGTLTSPTEMEGFIWGAKGTVRTCEMQGFLLCSGLYVAIAWDIALSFTFVLMVRYNWRKKNLAKVEKVVHAIVWAFAIGTSVAAVVTDSMNPSGFDCFMGVSPLYCDTRAEDDCVRGEEYSALLMVIYFVIITLGTIINMACMLTLYLTARHRERRNQRYSRGLSHTESTTNFSRRSITIPQRVENQAPRRSAQEPQHRLSNRIATQGMLYTSVWLGTGVPIILVSILAPEWSSGPSVVFLQSWVNLYGFFYLFPFLRHRKQMRTRYGTWIKYLLCGLCKNETSSNGSGVHRQRIDEHGHDVDGSVDPTSSSSQRNPTSSK